MDGDVSGREISAQLLAPSQAPGPLNSRAVAVLPLVNQSSDPKLDYFCEGITDGIIYTLSRIPLLNVIGRTSMFAFKGQDARHVGARLRAGTTVDGTVRKSGNRLKIFTELIDVASGEVRWADTYERMLNDVFAVVAEIAEAVVQGVLHTKLTLRSLISGAPDMHAYLLFLNGWHALSRWTVEGFRAAAEIFGSATSLYPSHAGLAAAYAGLTLSGLVRAHEVAPRSLHAAQQALALDSTLPPAYACLGFVTAFYEWKWDQGAAYARKAAELAPSEPFSQLIHGLCILAHGKMGDAQECFEHAVALDPLSVRANRMLGFALFLARRFASAEQWLQGALTLNPESIETRMMVARTYMCMHRFDVALGLAERYQGDPVGLSVSGACLAHLNRREEALKTLATLSRMAKYRYVPLSAFARIHLVLGNMDRTIEYLARSLDEREPLTAFLKLDPEWDPLRDDPRFGELVSRLGL
jgi:serine/threonine-protein kinase